MAKPVRRRRLRSGLWAVGAVAWMALQYLDLPGAANVSSALVSVAALIAAILCLRARSGVPGERRRGWTLIGLGCLSYSLGNAAWPIYQLTAEEVPPFSLVDVGCLGMVPLLMAGAAALIGRPPAALRTVLDGVLISGSLLVLSWATSFGAALRTWGGDLDRVISLAYPLGDVAVATMMLMLLIHSRGGERRPAALVSTGMLGLCVADGGYAYFLAIGSQDFEAFAYTGWLGCFVLVGLGARSARYPARAAGWEVSPSWLALPYVPLVLALATVTSAYLRDDGIDSFVFGVCAVLVALVMIRQVVAVQDNMRLGRQLSRTVAELHASQEQLRNLAFYDQLTGLANRTCFYRTAEGLFAPGPAAERPVAVLFIDLDRFKPVNDRLGHAAGDELLAMVGERLRNGVRPDDLIARLGGDEFAVLLDDVPSHEAVQAVADRLHNSLNQPFTVNGELVTIGASMGMVVEPNRRASFDSLLARADAAMYEAKSKCLPSPVKAAANPTIQ